jgi:hypothetical protein
MFLLELVMSFSRKSLFLAIFLIASLVATKSSFAQGVLVPPRNPAEPKWEGQVLLLGEERERVKSMPITARPNRVGHFYGNTVRRIHYRGSVVPLPRDVVNMTYSFVARP